MKDLGLSALISDGMIIQRDKPFPIWSKKRMTVNFLGKTYEASESCGKWLVTLDPVQAGGPFTMDITCNDACSNYCDKNKIAIQDIYAGDVWLCSGQSNMEMQMDRLLDDFGEEWLLKDFPLIRQFKVPQQWDFSAPREEITGGNWLSASAETLHEFSGTAWFFAKNLYEKYRQSQTVPIGLVNTAWGGTPVEAWMSEDALISFPGKIADGRQYADDKKREDITQNANSAIQEWETNLRHEDQGLPQEWKNPETDISAWNDITLPGDFADAGLKNFCGVIWLAKEFEAGAAQNTSVWLGTIIDADTVYLNGIEIGNTGYRYPPRKYSANGLLKQGKNRIVIRVTCNGGEGGVTTDKPFNIFTDNQTIELSGNWKYKVGAEAQTRPEEFFFQRMPMGNYNAMVAPVLKFPLKGVIWYQGESNDPNPHEYAQLFRLMINDWREKNGSENLPFFFVQLPILGKEADNNEQNRWPILREAQASALSLPATGMAAALELGEWNDIHPVNKKDVGYRLFLAAEKLLFGVENSSPGPVMNRLEKSNEYVYLYFDNCAGGLTLETSATEAYMSVVGDEGQIRLPVKIEGKDFIFIDVSSVKNPKKILYAWADNPRDRQLFNSEGLPMLPFRVEIT
jgi:sialate O-acetylesterase